MECHRPLAVNCVAKASVLESIKTMVGRMGQDECSTSRRDAVLFKLQQQQRA